MKLMVWVRPGVELTCAIFCPSSALIKLDLPTFERPRKAISGALGAGKCSGAAADFRKHASSFINSYFTTETRSTGREGIESVPSAAADACVLTTRPPPQAVLSTSKSPLYAGLAEC